MKLPGLTPPKRADADALDSFALLVKANRDKTLIIAGLMAALITSSLGYIVLLPLKENTPYTVEVNKITGEVSVPTQQEATKFVPSDDNKLFFVRRWLKAEFTIQPQLAKSNEELALSQLRGDVAINKHNEFRAADKTFARLAQEPTLVRDVTIDNITPVAGGQRNVVANMTWTTTSRGATVIEKKLITVYYEILPPKTQKDRVDHPIGLYVVDFGIANTSN